MYKKYCNFVILTDLDRVEFRTDIERLRGILQGDDIQGASKEEMKILRNSIKGSLKSLLNKYELRL